MRGIQLIGAAVLVTALAGCGSDTSGTQSSSNPSQTPADGPSCADLWVAGETLPKGYTVCVAEGALVTPSKIRCESGQTILTYDDRFWAVPGYLVSETSGLGDDAKFQKVLRRCTA